MATAPMFMPKMSGGPEEHVKFSLLIVKLLINFKMKKINKLGLIFTLIMIFMSCEELPDPAGLRGKAVVPAITNINPGIFDSKDLENSYVEFVVTVPEGSTPEKITVQGSYQDNYERVTMSEVTSFPSTVRILSSEAAQKLGIALSEIVNGDTFTFELLTSANGTTTRSTAVLIVPVACAYDVNLAIGSYHAISDWPSEFDVTITSDPDDPYTVYVAGLSEIDGCVEDNGPFVLHINPATYAITTETKMLASDYFGYGSVTYSGNGVYSSCDGTYTLNIDISIGAYGSQGIYQFNITRNP